MWGAKLELKSVLRHLVGTWLPQEASLEPKDAILVDVGFLTFHVG